MKLKRWICLVVLGLCLNACAWFPSNELDATSWNLIEVNGHTPVPDSTVNLHFAAGKVSGRSGCNTYGGNYQARGNGRQIQFTDIFVTLMACVPQEISDQEQEYLGLLNQTLTYQTADGQLSLMDQDGTVVLRFSQAE